jgi:hypothetical protein
MKTHKETYPQQYNHPFCGKKVRVRTNGKVGKVERVINSRFGKLVIFQGKSKIAWLLAYCDIVE